MTTTNFPNGITSYGIPVVGSGSGAGASIPTSSGNYYFVCNRTGANGSNGNEGTDMAAPLSTLAFAYSKCTASNGDVIVILPGHAETISAALTWATAGVTIVGLGVGTNRPTFTLDTANTNRINVTAVNNKVSGCIFVGNFLSIATLFLLTTASGFTVTGNEFRDTDATKGFLSLITTTVSTTLTDVTYANNVRISGATTTPGPDIVIAGTTARWVVKYNTSYHTTISNNVAALIAHGALVVSGLDCGYNIVYSVNTDSASGALLVTTSATTGYGMIYNNYVACLDTAAPLLITAAAVQYFCFNNYVSGDVGLSGYLLPAAGTAT